MPLVEVPFVFVLLCGFIDLGLAFLAHFAVYFYFVLLILEEKGVQFLQFFPTSLMFVMNFGIIYIKNTTISMIFQ